MNVILVVGLILALLFSALTIPAIMLSSLISAVEDSDNLVE